MDDNLISCEAFEHIMRIKVRVDLIKPLPLGFRKKLPLLINGSCSNTNVFQFSIKYVVVLIILPENFHRFTIQEEITHQVNNCLDYGPWIHAHT